MAEEFNVEVYESTWITAGEVLGELEKHCSVSNLNYIDTSTRRMRVVGIWITKDRFMTKTGWFLCLPGPLLLLLLSRKIMHDGKVKRGPILGESQRLRSSGRYMND